MRVTAKRMYQALLLAASVCAASGALAQEEGWDKQPAGASRSLAQEEEGYKQPAREGYALDENGREFQIAFDMGNRFYIGGRWEPLFDNDIKDLSRGGVDFGLRISDYESWDNERHRHRVLEGEVSLAPLDFDILLWRYDMGKRHNEPSLWLTTFIGKPRRIDFNFDLGWGMRMLKADYHPMRSSDYTDLENLWLYPSWEIYHNKNLENYVRFAIGPAVGELLSGAKGVDTRVAVYPQAALESEFVFDDRGLHQMGFAFTGSVRPYFDDPDTLYRVGEGAVWYEWVVLALNDQPISIFAQGTASFREDIPDLPSEVEYRAMVGMRFSFWAPVPEDFEGR